MKTSTDIPSTKNALTDWENLVVEEDEEVLEGDAALTGLFQTLYRNADDDTKRAMIKSYTESDGTSLSTDWRNVSRAKVETQPPDGMEARSFLD